MSEEGPAFEGYPDGSFGGSLVLRRKSELDPQCQTLDVGDKHQNEDGDEPVMNRSLSEEEADLSDLEERGDGKILIQVKEQDRSSDSGEDSSIDVETENHTNNLSQNSVEDSEKGSLNSNASQTGHINVGFDNEELISYEGPQRDEVDEVNSGDTTNDKSDIEVNNSNKVQAITLDKVEPGKVKVLAAGNIEKPSDEIIEIPDKMENDSLHNSPTIPMIDIDQNSASGERHEDAMEMKEKTEDSNKASNGQAEGKAPDGDQKLSPDGKDNVDAASVYSLFMEKDFRYYFQHPYLRLFIAYFVVFCNFLIYAEDPVAHSVKECNIPVIGNNFAFIFTRYPPNAWSLLKVVLWLIAIIIGMIIGKMLFHTFLFNKIFRLKMFSDDQGSWMTMFMTTLVTVFIMSYIYNGFLMIGGDATEPYRISVLLGLSNSIFMKAAATGTWCGDFFTAWMVTDIMLQEKLYPHWAVGARKWWKKGYNRIILFWIVVFVTSFVVIFVIATDYIVWDKLNRGFLPTNEVSRAILASFILVMDITIVMQDWDFPHFISAFDVKLPGINMAHIRFEIPSFLRKDSWLVHISGKWFNYGILFIVIILDMNMWKNQIFYIPYDYGQYTGPDERIYTVLSSQQLDMFNETFLTYDFRNQTINPLTNQTYISEDTVIYTLYKSFSLGIKCIAFIPSVSAFLLLGILIWMYGRYPAPTKENPYGGRLKKRKKKRFSLRSIANSFRRKSKSHAKDDDGVDSNSTSHQAAQDASCTVVS